MASATRPPDGSNRAGPLVGLNLYQSDPALVALLDAVPHPVSEQIAALGAFWGSQEAAELGRLAEDSPPRLKAYDAAGNRLDAVDYHPSYTALMRRSVGSGLHCSVWDASGAEGAVRSVARAARLYLAAQVDSGHLAAASATNAAIAALAHQPNLAESWLPLLRSRKYDPSTRPAGEKAGAMLGIALAEKQAGTDFRGLATTAVRVEERNYRVTGHKWFVAAPSSDAFVTLAQTQEGLTALLVPRHLPDGSRNAIRLARLKDRLGPRSAATGEFEFEGATGFLIGQAGHGLSAISEMTTLCRLDSVVVSAALMRAAVIDAIHHARHRRVGNQPLSSQPIMVRVLADLSLDAIAASALAFRLAESFDRANDDPTEAAFARLMTPVVKYWVCKAAMPLIAEAIECIGGNGTVEEHRVARLYRAAPAQAVDGPGNVLCLDVLKILRKTSEPLEAVLAHCENALGEAGATTVNVLRAAAAVALADEGSARVLTEQLAMTVAAATLRRTFPAVIADAFIATRLGKEWRTTYGMLDSRFDAAAFVNYVLPQG